jgi:iron complex transport system ATP-binding protein
VKLDARDITVEIGGRRVVDSVSFEVDEREVVAILGPNGAGKTSLLKAVLDLTPHGGSVQAGGVDLASLDFRARARLVAYVPQRSELASDFSVHDVVAQSRYPHVGGLGAISPADEREVARAMELVDVQRFRDRSFAKLSEGERRRVLLARALATGAKCLLLDEPTAALDVRHSLELFARMRELSAERSFAVVLHDLNDALRFSSRALILRRGRTIAFGKTADVVVRDTVREVFDVEMKQGALAGFELEAGS